MPCHLTIRMAWHDTGWNGKICQDPEANIYCTSAHSLLSERIARNKNTTTEIAMAGAEIGRAKPYLPPCFWSLNAFGDASIDVRHAFPFQVGRLPIPEIPDTLPSQSVFTWPFRLAFNRDKDSTEGAYAPALRRRVEDFRKAVKSRRGSLAFLYANYGNPVSADDQAYLLVGAAKVDSVGELSEFKIDPEAVATFQNQGFPRNKNFTPLNWALKVSYGKDGALVRVPYQQMLARVASHPEDEAKLERAKCIISEESVRPYFKFVSELVPDHIALYLLYKLTRSLEEGRSLVPSGPQQSPDVVRSFLAETWKRRGSLPGLGAALEVLAYRVDSEAQGGEGLVATLRKSAKAEADLLVKVRQLLTSSRGVPPKLKKFQALINAARSETKVAPGTLDLLLRLAQFDLTTEQMIRIAFPGEEAAPFGPLRIRQDEIIANPYILYEEFVPSPSDWDDDLTIESAPIGIEQIDLGMFPDTEFQAREEPIHTLHPAGPERLRALIIDFLRDRGRGGDCFASLEAVCDHLRQHPLVHRDSIAIRESDLLEGRFTEHFSKRLTFLEENGKIFVYLNEIRRCEEIVSQRTRWLLEVPERAGTEPASFVSDVASEAKKLTDKIPGFEQDPFTEERLNLLRGLYRQSLFVIAGKPGTGKTKSLSQALRLCGLGRVKMLAPTGKAALRLGQATERDDVETIDRFVYTGRYGDYIDDPRLFFRADRPPKVSGIDTLVIDESSMVDLVRLATIFEMVEWGGLTGVKRLILVGDSNQLPPIGYGRPFHDLVEFLRSKQPTRDRNLVRLRTNCRQEYDDGVLQAIAAFESGNRYQDDIVRSLGLTGELSRGLRVHTWKRRSDLFNQVCASINQVIHDSLNGSGTGDPSRDFNLLLGLGKDGGFLDFESLSLDTFQIITPYNPGFFGTYGLNGLVREEFKKGFWPPPKQSRFPFANSEKIIRTVNWYRWVDAPHGQWGRDVPGGLSGPERKLLWKLRQNQGRGAVSRARRELVLANGAIGVFTTDTNSRAIGHFPDGRPSEFPLSGRSETENFDPAYAITIHKSQGSEFDHVFVVIPEKRTLLTRELIYTALSRSRKTVTLFVQEVEGEPLLELARSISSVVARNSSLFQSPIADGERIIEPEKGRRVRSKVEYIIYKALMAARSDGRLNFTYEKELHLESAPPGLRVIHPDFTIEVSGRIYYWEHLGMLDLFDYNSKWTERRHAYDAEGLGDRLVTTDDLNGLTDERVNQVLSDLSSSSLQGKRTFSNHHYSLSPAG
jgi:exodeoxyribonuclease V alpha subunit